MLNIVHDFIIVIRYPTNLLCQEVDDKGEDDVTINILDVKSNHVYVLVHCMVGLIIL